MNFERMATIIAAIGFAFSIGACSDTTKEAMFLKEREALQHGRQATESNDEANAVVAKVSESKGGKVADMPAETSEKGKPDTNPGKGNDGKPNPGKGEDTDTDGEDGMGDGAQDGDVTETDDDEDTGGKTPAQTPNQAPVEPTTPPEEDDDDEIVVDLPEEACIYNDPANPNFTIPKDQFGPALPPVAVPRAKIAGDIQTDGTTFIGNFTVFQKHANSPEWMLDWDGKAGRIPHHFTLVVVGSSNSECTAYLRHVAHDPRTLNGCFDQNTKIRMADGKDQVIALITVGDLVWNPATKQGQRVKKVVRGPESLKSMYDIGTSSKVVRMTEDHPVPTKDGLKQAKEITTKDFIRVESGEFQAVMKAEKLPVNDKQIVINLELETDRTDSDAHMVLSDGIISGDLFLQNKLATDKSGVAQN